MANNKVHFIACGIFQPELIQVLTQIQAPGLFNCIFEVKYLQAGLHSNLDALKKEIISTLSQHADERTLFLYGSKCHPELSGILDRYPVTGFFQDNCILLILGENTNVCDIPDEALLKFFEYTGCPIEIEDIGRDLFKKRIIGAISRS